MKYSPILFCLGLAGVAFAAPQPADTTTTGEVVQRADGSFSLKPRFADLDPRQGPCLECPCTGWDPDSCCCPRGRNCCNRCNTCA
ncbi:hypothetical protein GGTG_00322 [Gaeumannomyces tritici R3-111a-1]|uniref:Uncharacterized protein n=1 Tax=Gaeumannomyces tritici (strain R3-111a-1) TaxID=644352 RepID=J3NGD1_GAET3|nr:hypothetical protein GGTG_00322 [Gaeumannomyces tritici R3-111a-1]EJT80321.1 hypothetical protein GGTG_00322 [Gaeumannomyces tritici R3-111a-1]